MPPVGLKIIFVFRVVTVTVQLAVFDPSFVVAVITAVPSPTVLTKPEETVATELLLDDHVTDLFAALEGVTVAVSEKTVSGSHVSEVLF